ncbi:DUF4376 domain-containing protein [Paucibacter sp. O1-1]|nr:DUF4376 domain-containing protein [Paucibacter sp. O1-1]MDA3827860.1 DUF4376 domain-containing protein [Paucibacter sp. O1-1]
MNDYAIIDSQSPPRVVRLQPVLGSAPLEPGLLPAALPEPLAHWPEAPHPAAELVWVNNALSWLDPRSLEQMKADKNDEINAARLAANRGGFMFAGKLISTDELSRSDIDGTNGTVTLTGDFPAGWPGVWKTEDNSYVPIPDIETWKLFYAAMSAQGAANFATSQALKAQLALAESPEQVEAVAWPS